MSWLKKLLPPKINRDGGSPKKNVPEGLWSKCDACEAVLYRTDLEKNLYVCPKCNHHNRLSARERLDSLLDPEGRYEIGYEVLPVDTLKFKDSRRYTERLDEARKETEEDDALIGVNDTGAIAYLAGRKTFDVVGLTTEGEAPYWARGAGARFEHWERRDAARLPLPTHLFVYRQWMAMDAVLGQTLTEATVRDQSILGAATMTAAEADYELLGSGETPFSEVKGVLIGTLDVADAESEALHAYELGDARSHWCVAKVGFTPDDRRLADGGRIERVRDRFQVSVTSPVTLVMRVSSQSALEVWANGKKLGLASIIAQGEGFDERAIAVPQGTEDVVVRPTEPVRFASFHYWWFAD